MIVRGEGFIHYPVRIPIKEQFTLLLSGCHFYADYIRSVRFKKMDIKLEGSCEIYLFGNNVRPLQDREKITCETLSLTIIAEYKELNVNMSCTKTSDMK